MTETPTLKSKPDLRGLAAIVLVAYLAVGCVLTQSGKTEPLSNQPDNFNQLVAKDVVSVLRQVDSLSPTTTTLGTSDTSLQQGLFAEALKNELQAAGYAIRAVGSGPATLPVSYRLERLEESVESGAANGAQVSQTVTVNVGDIAVRRTYIAQADGQIIPVGAMQARGVDPSGLKLDNNIFSKPAHKVQSDVPPAESTVPVLEGEHLVSGDQNPPAVPAYPEQNDISDPREREKSDASLATLATNNTSQPLLDLIAPSVATAKPQSFDAIGALADKNTQNVRELQQSNFESLFVEMGIVGEKVLTFANDSTRMGDNNKARLRELLRSFNPGSDVLSVVGCSLGPTRYEGGQEGLALGRAMRVREELLYAGIPEDKILAEGCWDEESFDERMPRRGVVVTLKRAIS